VQSRNSGASNWRVLAFRCATSSRFVPPDYVQMNHAVLLMTRCSTALLPSGCPYHAMPRNTSPHPRLGSLQVTVFFLFSLWVPPPLFYGRPFSA